ncbi:DUF998 domain-containing protein [Cognatishimia sp. WU-CL00825]|uniref:hypothetical protein n=1 Tax=Cognatishimia sp. WU-CL00825 TaxID=3127658 RepID=UPI003106263E
MATHNRDTFIMTYFNVRQALGVIAMAFPLVLLTGGYITHGQVLPSISDYYFSSMRDFVVGALVAIGIFLMAYQGDRPSHASRRENITGLLSGASAIGLALFPNKPHANGIETFFHAIMDDRISVGLHFLSSFVFLTTLTIFCLSRFARTANGPVRRVYRICGWLIISAGVLATYASFVRAFDWFDARVWVEQWNLIFWLEACGIWAFCVSWLLKGEVERQDARTPSLQASRHLASRWVPSQ